jgi:hypothetical protein
MSLAATSKRRTSADPLSVALAKNKDAELTTEPRDWTRPTMATAVSLLAHAVLFGVLAILYVNRRGTEYAEVVPIEANLNVPVNLFDMENADAKLDVPLTSPLAESNATEAPAKLETPSDDQPSFHDLAAGLKALDPSSKGPGAKAGEGLPAAGGGSGDVGPRTNLPGGLSAVGRRIVYVIDRSASMNKPQQNPAIEWAKDELIRSIKQLQPNMSFQIVFYSDTVVTLPNPDRRNPLIPATEFAKDKAIQFVRDLEAEGGTNHQIGLDRGFELRPDVIFFMTDADDDTDADLKRLINWVTTINRRKSEQQSPASIHMIQLWHRDDSPSGVIRELAQRNNGSYRLIRASELGKRLIP